MGYKDLECLTREELLRLFHQHSFFMRITERDILRAKQDCMFKKARALMDTAINEMEQNKGFKKFNKWFLAHQKFARAMALYDEAENIILRAV